MAAQAPLDLQLVFEADGGGSALQAAERAEQLELHQAPRWHHGESVGSMGPMGGEVGKGSWGF